MAHEHHHAPSSAGAAIDPVCGMEVSRANAPFQLEQGGTTYYFCCGGCQAAFAADPERFLRPADASSNRSEAPKTEPMTGASAWVCPMCPGVREAEAGPCPSCGMALEAEQPSAPAVRTVYTCPMHPEVQSDEREHVGTA